MIKKKLVIVESPTKARTIKKFLSKDYEVESCMGHLRDLPESAKDIPKTYKKYKWSRLGVNIEDNFKPIYCIPVSKKKVVDLLKKKAKTAEEIILATDEDREGESISWHIQEMLKSSKSKFKRMVFHEITKEAILESLNHFRKVNKHLVYAQETRRILDRLVGYTISPVLWKHVARGLSAGRVQSVAVKLLSEREFKRMGFKKSKYWSLQAHFLKGKNNFIAQLSSYKGTQLAGSSDFDRDTGELKKKKLLLDEKKAKSLTKELQKLSYIVSDVQTTSITRKPQAPFTTSTLQQEANRKLSLSAKETMNLAQKLYERGFITYMRTDAVFLSKQAVSASRAEVKRIYGKNYIPEKARIYKNKSKGAQEAHEAIRPAGNKFTHPQDTKLTGYLLKLYQMVWQRTLASQAVDCKQKRVSAVITAAKNAQFSASGTTMVFDGFYKIYQETKETKENQLPPLQKSDTLKCQKITNHEHETRPPARFNEASLIQTLEQEGIGRPSTYAPIIATIQKRGYVFKDKNMLIPTMTGLIVTKFLTEHFPNYVSNQFTADMEQVLDDIALGETDHIQYLEKIYFGKKGLKNQVDNQKEAKDSRSIAIDGLKGFIFYAGPYGAYVTQNKNGASVSLPINTYPGDLNKEMLMDMLDKKERGHESLGKDPVTKEAIYVLNGKYGPYVQRGEVQMDKKKAKNSVKRVSIPRGLSEDDIDLNMALKLLQLPETLGSHPETEKEIKKGIGRFGPYIVHDGDFRSIKSIDDFFKLTLKDALKILSEPKRGSRKKVLKDLGAHTDTGKSIQVLDGKYGPYIQHGSQKISLPKEISISALTLTQALGLLGTSIKKKNEKVNIAKNMSAAVVKNRKSKKSSYVQ